MSETTNILLPDAQIDIFAGDAQIVAAALALIEDWRFARVSVHVEEGGDVDAAIAAYSAAKSPNIIVIQSDDVSDDFTAKLEQLADHCDEDTNAIVIGPENDVKLYRRLIKMGVSDYLVRPVETEDMAEILAKTLIDQIGITGSRLLSFCGAKGGVGTSVLAQNAARYCADILGQKTVFLDAGGGWSSNSVGFGFEPSTTFYEVLRAAEAGDEDSLKRMMFKPSDNLHILATGGDVMLDDNVTSQDFEVVLDMLMTRYPVVIVDLSGAVPSIKKMMMRRSSQLFLVTGASLPSLRLARVLMQEISDLRGGVDDESAAEDVRLILNMQGISSGDEASQRDIEEALERKLSAKIAFDPKLFMAAEAQGKALADHKGGDDVVQRQIAPLMRDALNIHKDSAAGKDDARGGLLNKIIGSVKGG